MSAAEQSMAAIASSRLHLVRGECADAVAHARLGLAHLDGLERTLVMPIALSTLATVAIHQGNLAAAAEFVEQGQDYLRDAPGSTTARMTWVAVRLAAAQEGPKRAVEMLNRVYDALSARPLLLTQESAAASWLVRTALAVEDASKAEAVLAAAERLVVDNPDFASLAVAATHARGLLERNPDALASAAAQYPDPWVRSCAAEDLGGLLAGSGVDADRGGAVRNLDDALHGFERVGALPDAARVRAALRTLGVRRRHWNRVDHPVAGWASLTDTERTVAGLVAEGLTNRQVGERMFLSSHTVSFHLRHVFGKLSIRSRVELATRTVERTGRIATSGE
jgi:DNA-binding CsgD family transcriptional regulator